MTCATPPARGNGAGSLASVSRSGHRACRQRLEHTGAHSSTWPRQAAVLRRPPLPNNRMTGAVDEAFESGQKVRTRSESGDWYPARLRRVVRVLPLAHLLERSAAERRCTQRLRDCLKAGRNACRPISKPVNCVPPEAKCSPGADAGAAYRRRRAPREDMRSHTNRRISAARQACVNSFVKA
jgi:hypothetical protein